jgi:hypothetical protein
VFGEEADMKRNSTTLAFFPCPQSKPSICKSGVSGGGG